MTLMAAASAALLAYLGVGLLLGAEPARLPVPRLRPPQLRRRLREAGLTVHPALWVGFTVAAGLGAARLGAVLTGSDALGVVVGAAAAAGPWWEVTRRRDRRMAAAARAWPDALRFVAASLRSGRTLPGALGDLEHEGPAPLRPYFERFDTRCEVLGVQLTLEIIRDELADPVSDRVVEVLVTAFGRGGSLIPALLTGMAESTTEDLRTIDEIETNSLEQKLNAGIVIVIPWAVLVAITTRPGPFRDFYSSPAGTAVIISAAILSLVGLGFLIGFGRAATEPRLVSARRSS